MAKINPEQEQLAKRIAELLERGRDAQNDLGRSSQEFSGTLQDVLSKLGKQRTINEKINNLATEYTKRTGKTISFLDEQNKKITISEKLQNGINKRETSIESILQARNQSLLKIENAKKAVEQKTFELNSKRLKLSELITKQSELQRKLAGALNVDAQKSYQAELKSVESEIEEANVQEKLLESIRGEITAEEKLLKLADKKVERFDKQISKLKTQKQIQEASEKITQRITRELNIPSSFSDMIEDTYERFKSIDKSATSLRQQFGMFRKEAEGVEEQVKLTALSLAKFGATAEDMQKTMSTLGKNFNYITMRNEEMVKNVVLMNKQFGISEETSSKFLKTLGGISAKSAETKTEMLGFATATAKAYGIGLDDLMNDVANASQETRLFARGSAEELIKAAAQARQMGTSFDKMTSSTAGLLDFETSIAEELKLSAMLGQNINANRIRELKFQGKHVEAQEEILKLARETDILNKDFFSQQSFLKLMGMTAEELQNQLEASSRMKDVQNSNNETTKKILKEQQKQQSIIENGTQDQIKALIEKEELERRTIANQTRIEELQNRISASIQTLMLPALEGMTLGIEGVRFAFEKLKIDELLAPMVRVGSIIRNIPSGFNKIGDMLGGITNSAKKFGDSIGSVLKSINITKILKPLEDYIDFFKVLRLEGKSFSESIISAGKEIGGTFGKISNKIGEIIKPLDTFIEKIFSAVKTTRELLSTASGVVSKVLEKIKPVTDVFINLSKYAQEFITSISTFSTKIIDSLKPLQSMFLGVINQFKILKVLFSTVKIAGLTVGIGEVLMILEGLYKAITRIPKIWSDSTNNLAQKILATVKEVVVILKEVLIDPFIFLADFVGDLLLPDKIINGFRSAGKAIYNAIIWPFDKFYSWFMDLLGGKSPSKISNALLTGFSSISNTLFTVLVSPFKNATQLIQNIFKFDLTENFLDISSSLEIKLLNPFKNVISSIKELLQIDPGQYIKNVSSSLKSALIDPFLSATTNIKELLTLDLSERFKGVGVSLKSALVDPFLSATNNIKELLTLDLSERFKGVGASLKSALIVPFVSATNNIKELLTLDLSERFKGVGASLKSALVDPFLSATNDIKELLTLDLSERFKGVGASLKGDLIVPFVSATNDIKELLTLDLSERFKGVGASLKSALVAPFVNATTNIKELLTLDLSERFKGVGASLKSALIVPFVSATTNIKELLTLDLSERFKGVGASLKGALIVPFVSATNNIKELLTLDLGERFKNIKNSLNKSIYVPIVSLINSIKKLFNFNLFENLKMIDVSEYINIFNKIKSLFKIDFSDILPNQSGKVLIILENILLNPFNKTILAVTKLLSNINLNNLVTGITKSTSILTSLFDNFILSTINNLSKIPNEIVQSITNTGGKIYNSLVSPFQMGFAFISEVVGSGMDVVGNTINKAFDKIKSGLEMVWSKIKGIGEFIVNIAEQGFTFVNKITTTSSDVSEKIVSKPLSKPTVVESVNNNEDVVKAILSSNKIVSDKLDMLSQMMASGKIGVYIDGQRVNQSLSLANIKLGSLGQATTT